MFHRSAPAGAPIVIAMKKNSRPLQLAAVDELIALGAGGIVEVAGLAEGLDLVLGHGIDRALGVAAAG